MSSAAKSLFSITHVRGSTHKSRSDVNEDMVWVEDTFTGMLACTSTVLRAIFRTLIGEQQLSTGLYYHDKLNGGLRRHSVNVPHDFCESKTHDIVFPTIAALPSSRRKVRHSKNNWSTSFRMEVARWSTAVTESEVAFELGSFHIGRGGAHTFPRSW